MAHHIIEYDCICTSCKGTGIYIGFAEMDGFGVVCHYCKGTGKKHIKIEYDDFKKKVKRDNVVRVLEVNPGFGAGIGHGFTEESFGGMPYSDWWKGKQFPAKSEMRLFTCPSWWYQAANYELKPDWDWCKVCGAFSGCDHFKTKEECWKRFDQEQTR